MRGAEAALGAGLPDDYRKFLASIGPTELLIRLSEQSSELGFYRPAELATLRRDLFGFIARTENGDDKVTPYFRAPYGVSIRDLVPIAAPAQPSRCLVIHLAQGERFGWCFHWDHDGGRGLERPTPSFNAALKVLTDGIERRDPAILGFLGIHLD